MPNASPSFVVSHAEYQLQSFSLREAETTLQRGQPMHAWTQSRITARSILSPSATKNPAGRARMRAPGSGHAHSP